MAYYTLVSLDKTHVYSDAMQNDAMQNDAVREEQLEGMVFIVLKGQTALLEPAIHLKTDGHFPQIHYRK
jgi:hypothetical protein